MANIRTGSCVIFFKCLGCLEFPITGQKQHSLPLIFAQTRYVALTFGSFLGRDTTLHILLTSFMSFYKIVMFHQHYIKL